MYLTFKFQIIKIKKNSPNTLQILQKFGIEKEIISYKLAKAALLFPRNNLD